MDTPTVVAVEPFGKGEIASFSTSSKTYFANGYPCHNTEWYWKIDLHNLLHFLSLRCDKHAQWEIRVFADAMLGLITPIVPWCVEAWNDYHPYRSALLLTRLEVEAIKEILAKQPLNAPPIQTTNKREMAEWSEKSISLGFNPPQEV